MRRFECTEDGSSKFWEVETRGSELRIRFGKLGTDGRLSEKDLGSAAAAAAEAEKLVREKLKKGYLEIAGTAAAKGAAKTATKVGVAQGKAAPAAAPKPAGTAKAKAKAPPPKEPPPAASKAAAGPPASAARQAVWRDPTDRDALRVWADELAAEGDPRGEFMQLHLLDNPTEEQETKRAALEKKLGGKLVGPARPFLGYWCFDRVGMVSMVHCDGDQLHDGWEQILALNPRLTVCWTTLRKKTMATAEKVAQLPLSKLYFLRIESGLTDRALATLAPSLAGIRHFSIAGSDVTPEGLEAVAPHLSSLEFLCLAPPVSFRGETNRLNEFVRVLTRNAAFHKLRAVHFFRCGMPDAEHLAMLKRLPALTQVLDSFSPPIEADVIEPWMRGEE